MGFERKSRYFLYIPNVCSSEARKKSCVQLLFQERASRLTTQLSHFIYVSTLLSFQLLLSPGWRIKGIYSAYVTKTTIIESLSQPGKLPRFYCTTGRTQRTTYCHMKVHKHMDTANIILTTPRVSIALKSANCELLSNWHIFHPRKVQMNSLCSRAANNFETFLITGLAKLL